MKERWIRRREAIVEFEVAWQAAAPDQDLPSSRQVSNYLMSGLAVMQTVSPRREYRQDSVQAVAEVLARSGGRERILYATQDGPWAALWRVHRHFSDKGVVILGNTAFVERETGTPRRTLQRALTRGDLPGSQVGYTYFVPLKAMEQWQKDVASGPGPERLSAGDLPRQPQVTEPVRVVRPDNYFQ